MKRILILGAIGSMKSTLGERIAQILGIESIHLDFLYSAHDFQNRNDEDWLEEIKNLISKEDWVMDGNFLSSFEVRMRRADTVIFLDFPRRTLFFKAFHGFLKRYTDRISIMEINRYYSDIRQRILEYLDGLEDTKEVFILQSQIHVDRFLFKLRIWKDWINGKSPHYSKFQFHDN